MLQQVTADEDRLLTRRNIKLGREVTADAWRTCNTKTKVSRNEYDRRENAVRHNEEMKLGRTDARTPCVYASVYRLVRRDAEPSSN